MSFDVFFFFFDPRMRSRARLREKKPRLAKEAEEKKSLTLLLVLDGDLGLAVGPQPRHGAVLADLGQLVAELGGEHVRERHQLGGLVGSVAVSFFF